MAPIAEQPRPRHRSRSYFFGPPDTSSVLLIICSKIFHSVLLLDVGGSGLAVTPLPPRRRHWPPRPAALECTIINMHDITPTHKTHSRGYPCELVTHAR